MSNLLAIGATGVRAYQTALTTVSENIANAGAAGYSRRSATLGEIVSSASANATMSGSLSGYGVRITGIDRQTDAFRVAETRLTGAELARSNASVEWLERIETALTGYDMPGRMTGFYASASTLAADPGSGAPRAAMVESATALASSIQGTHSTLTGSMADLDGTAQANVAQLNDLSQQVAKTNVALGRVGPGTAAQAQLFDERDRLLGAMSQLTDIDVQIDNRGLATVRAGGSTGPVLVELAETGFVRASRSDGALGFTVERAGSFDTLHPRGGALSGLVEGAQRIGDAIDALNVMARDLADGINAIQAGGDDLDGNPGTPMFAMGADASDFRMVLTGPRAIAAASSGAGVRNNGNLAALESFRQSSGLEDRATGLSVGNATTLAARRSVAAAQATIHDNAVAARDTVSGVNLDEEAVDLIRFQQAYNASSRIIQVARETFQSILDAS